MPYSPKTYKTEAIVLRHYPIGEADYLLVLYTPGKGKVRAVAKGARRIKSKLGGHVEPPMRTSLFLSRGQNLDSVSQAEALEGFRPLREDLQRLSQALYMLELVDAFSQEDQANYPVYRLTLDSLRSLAQPLSENAPPALLPFFQMRLLDYTGFRPELAQCVECDSGLEPGRHSFAAARGGTLCDSCRPPGVSVLPMSLNAIKVLRFLQKESMPSAERLTLEPETLAEVDRLLGSLLRYVLDRDLKSSRFLHQVAQRDAVGAAAVSTQGDPARP